LLSLVVSFPVHLAQRMAAEVLSVDDIQLVYPSQSSPSASRSPSPPHHSPIPVDDDDAPPIDHPEPAPRKPSLTSKPPSRVANGVVRIEDNAAAKEKKAKPSSSAKPGSSAAGAKPKSTKSAAARSPSPSPPPPSRPPLQTVRLDIPLGGPEDYEVDIAVLSKSTGQRAPTPVAAPKRDTSDDSHSDGDDEGEGDGKKVKRRRKRKNVASEYYDTNDPFIDDSELAQDERTFFAQTKQKGFYVSSGQVALLNKYVYEQSPSRSTDCV